MRRTSATLAVFSGVCEYPVARSSARHWPGTPSRPALSRHGEHVTRRKVEVREARTLARDVEGTVIHRRPHHHWRGRGRSTLRRRRWDLHCDDGARLPRAHRRRGRRPIGETLPPPADGRGAAGKSAAIARLDNSAPATTRNPGQHPSSWGSSTSAKVKERGSGGHKVTIQTTLTSRPVRWRRSWPRNIRRKFWSCLG